MSTMKNRKFKYEDANGCGIISLRICDMTTSYTDEDLERVFSKEELKNYHNRKNNKRKKELFWSRKMAKAAIYDINKEIKEMPKIHIGKGQFGQPIVKEGQRAYQVSITHCSNYAAAIAFPEEMMIGLDMEKVEHKEQIGIEDILTDREKSLIPALLNKEIFALIMWTAKEALGKFLRLGLTMNFDILQIVDVRPTEDGYQSEFRFFPGLIAYTTVADDIVYTLVYSKSITLKEEVNQTILHLKT